MTSRLITTAAIQNGSAFKYVRVTNDEVSRSLSAIGSRNAPSVLSSFQWRGGPPAPPPGRAPAAQAHSPPPPPPRAGRGPHTGRPRGRSGGGPTARTPGPRAHH